MAINSGLTLVTIPNPILRKKCRAITDITPEIVSLAEKMGLAMDEFKGVGLAAPQIGRDLRLIVVTDDRQGFTAMINPIITFSSKEKILSEEGCLSVPGVYGLVRRAAKIRYSYIDTHGKKITAKAKGLTAIIVQHECDHLNGVLFIDKAEKIIEGHDSLEKMQSL